VHLQRFVCPEARLWQHFVTNRVAPGKWGQCGAAILAPSHLMESPMTETSIHIPAPVASLVIGLALTFAIPAHAQSSDQQRQLLERADTNGDGDITRVEFDRVRAEMFARLDRNGDGNVDSKDRPRMFGDRFDQAYRMLAALDTDGNQRISRAELTNGEAPAFVAGDTNRDNILSRTEIAALSSSR
jgi:hypothetical protein